MATRKATPGGKPKQAASKQRGIQAEVDRRNAKKSAAKKAPGKAKKTPVQAGTRRQPENPFPAQRQRKPGHEHKLDPQPRFLAPDYVGSGKLEGMVALVTGGDSGIGRAVAATMPSAWPRSPAAAPRSAAATGSRAGTATESRTCRSRGCAGPRRRSAPVSAARG